MSDETVAIEGKLTPAEIAGNTAKQQILDLMELAHVPDEMKPSLTRFADMAAAAKMEEVQKFMSESPAHRIMTAVEEATGSAKANESVQEQLNSWQKNITREKGRALLNGTQSAEPDEKIVSRLVALHADQGGMSDSFVVKLDSVAFKPNVQFTKAPHVEQVLRKLGFLPDSVTMETLDSIPYTSRKADTGNPMWNGTPTRDQNGAILGLQSKFMPDVAAQIGMSWEDNTKKDVYLLFQFKPKAIVQSTAGIPTVK